MDRVEVAKFVGTHLRRVGVFVGTSTLNADAASEIQSIHVAADGSHVSFFGKMGRVTAHDAKQVMFALELLPDWLTVEDFWRAMKGSGFKGSYWLPRKKKNKGDPDADETEGPAEDPEAGESVL